MGGLYRGILGRLLRRILGAKTIAHIMFCLPSWLLVEVVFYFAQ